MDWLETRSTRVKVFDRGAGEPVLALHSTGGRGAHWSALADTLGDGYRIVAPDLHGYGETAPWSGFGPMKLADEVAVVTQVLAGIQGPVHLVGHSYGGAVALSAALSLGHRLRSLTLVEPVAFHLLDRRDPADLALSREISGVASAVSDAVISGNYHGGMARFVEYWNGAGAWERLGEAQRTALARRIHAVLLNFWACRNEPTGRADYRSIEVPLRVIRGAATTAPAARIASIVARMFPRGELRVVAGAGHMLPLTHPAEVGALIAEHLSGRTRNRLLATSA